MLLLTPGVTHNTGGRCLQPLSRPQAVTLPVPVPSLAALSDQALSGCCPCGSVCLCSSQCSAQGHGTTGAACPTALLWLHTLPLWVPSLLHSLGQASTVGFSVQTCLDSIRGGRGVSLSPQLAKVGQMSLFHQQLSIATDPLAWDTQFQLSCLKSGRVITPPAASGPSAGSFAPHPVPSVSEGSGVGFGRLLTQSAQEQFQAAGLCFCQDILSLSGQEGWCGQCPPCRTEEHRYQSHCPEIRDNSYICASCRSLL